MIHELSIRQIDYQIAFLFKPNLLNLPAEWNPVTEYRRTLCRNQARLVINIDTSR